ncbi:hypothetical protein [Taylorella equigenitalis]|uniref:hypothetical protein n=1 Tax=Taylorella equigenitalis TaxID=29575 RepID=UPI00237E8C48|nr:hypothetical protein [Taylorella equigenitalis]WDU51895.1 hypothetical protein KNO32_00145 [Taylorella equigenitalis]
MSWRLLFFTLVLLAGVATLAGLQAGDWLVAHAPTQANLKNLAEEDPSPVLGPDGTPILKEPPQPLMNGSIGVPQRSYTADWAIKKSSADQMLNQLKNDSLAPLIDPNSPSSVYSQGAGDNFPAPAPFTPPVAQESGNWEDSFQAELAACRKLKFGQRGECVSRVRNNYCTANNAWGTVSECER